MEARSETLPLERDLVLRGAFGETFYRLEGVGVSAAGDLYVLDQGRQRVFIFDAEGNVRGGFGRGGPGPGEFMWPWLISVVGTRVVLHSPRLARLSVFDLEGNHVADHSVPGRFVPRQIVGFDGHLFAVDAQEPMIVYGGGEPRSAPWIVGRYSSEGQLVDRIIEFAQTPQAYWTSERGAGEVPVREALPRAAFSDEVVYVTDGSEYQVLALRLDGDPVWALRVAYSAPGPNDEFKQALVHFGSSLPRELGRTPADPRSYVWPDHFATIENLEVDGRGNLYVFPYADRSPEELEDIYRPVPVDVYTSEGDRIFSGWSEIDGWDASLGDHVFRVERDPVTEEYFVARYRLETLLK